MKAGTIIKLPNGEIGTVVYNSLDGIGIKYGRYEITREDIQGHGNLFKEEVTGDYELYPDAMLREPYPSADIECVGSEYEIIFIPNY